MCGAPLARWKSILTSGQKFSAAGQAVPPPFAVQRIGLTLPREELYRRVDDRVDDMIALGWLDEVRGLIDQYAERHRRYRAWGTRK